MSVVIMTLARGAIVGVLLAVVGGGCGGDGQGPQGGADQGGQGAGGSGGAGPGGAFPPGSEANPRVDCTQAPEKVLAGIRGADTVPSWEQIDCYTKGLARKAVPATSHRWAGDAEDFGVGKNDDGASIDRYFDNLASLPGANIAALTLGNMPPHFDLKANRPYTYPLAPAEVDAKLRTAALVAIVQKRKGRVVELFHQWPPNLDISDINSVETYKDFIKTRFAAEKTAEAKAAEKLKIEIYYPLPVELEVIPRSVPFLARLSAAEQVAICQLVLDTVYAAVRPHFSGVLVAASHNRFAINDPLFKTIDYSKWDRLDVTLFPNCDQDLGAYLDLQIENYIAVAQASHVPWGAGEIDLVPHTFVRNAQGLGCMSKEEYAAAEPGMWRLLLEKVKAAPVRSISYGVPSKLANPETARVIGDFMKATP